MQRWTFVAIGTLLVIALGALTWQGWHSGPEAPTAVEAKAVAAAAPGAHASATGPTGSAASAGSAGLPTSDAGAGTGAGGQGVGLPEDDGGTFGADGGTATFLPNGTPKSVRFGVVVVRYRGAEGQPPSERSKPEAQLMARTLADVAKTDFRNAVSRGDPGSMEDAGRMPRGVLDPTVEYTLFTLKGGEVSDPIDTPRGFWILRRGD